MDLYCTRPGCIRPQNTFTDLDDVPTLKKVQQKYCTTCGMPLILDNRYLPVKLLGKGGFGTAFLARDRRTPAMRQCVVKQFQPAASLSDDQLQLAQNLFEREAIVLEQLGNAHPHIPDLYASFPLTVPSSQAGKQDEFFYLVQEFIDGQDMEQVLAQKGPLAQDEVAEILIAVLKILRFVHDNQSIHRDIKPSNVMRHQDGSIYLLDFGAVKQITKTAVGGTQGSTGIYSTGFAPPEQMAGGEVYPSTDLYALAVTCITLLTGQQPAALFDSYTTSWNWRSQVQVSDRFADILDRMLLASPNQRFQSAAEVLAAIAGKPPTSQSSVPSSSVPPSSVLPAHPSISQPSTPPSQATVSPPSPPQPTASPQPIAPSPQPSAKLSTLPTFSTLEILAGAAFAGFEGGLIAIASMSSLGIPLGAGVSLLVLAGLVFAQFYRVIEGIDLVLIAAATIAILYFFAPLRAGHPIGDILVLAGLAALVAIAATAFFRLIYNLLSRLV